ncbi:hypothetical protein [Streptomyces sp. WM6349]|uniref:hypothetical protein n=1 Tax=Streptomyces sp. WM6349 TaxID=1415552 RepID=UPI0006AEE1DC|nr:hypothetical protein [Streptomyces sp. WM6349]KOU17039.1 hypothetical protein ADK49_17010 [Streptomyces sp. WM6349]
MPATTYFVDLLMELPAHGGKPAGGRRHVYGDLTTPEPVTSEQLQDIVIRSEADRKGFDPAGVRVVEFTYTTT